MSMLQVRLNEQNSRKLAELSRQTGDSPDVLANRAVEQFNTDSEAGEQRKFQEWREALLRLEGIWADRTDLPDFDELRRSWDRNVWNDR